MSKEYREESRLHAVVLLNDGETYSHISGCEILFLTPEGIDALEDGIKPNNIPSRDIVYSIKLEGQDG